MRFFECLLNRVPVDLEISVLIGNQGKKAHPLVERLLSMLPFLPPFPGEETEIHR